MTKANKAALTAFRVWLDEQRLAVRVEPNAIDPDNWIATFLKTVRIHTPHGYSAHSPGKGTTPSDAVLSLATKVSGYKVEVENCEPTITPDFFAPAPQAD